MSYPVSAAGFLSFMNGYSVFLGPFVGIMVVDVSSPFSLFPVWPLSQSFCLSCSIGSFIEAGSMSLQCTTRKADIDTFVESYVISSTYL